MATQKTFGDTKGRCSQIKLDKEMAPAVRKHPEARYKGAAPLREHSVAPATRNGDPFVAASEACICCNDGWVTLGQDVLDTETGEETTEYALYICRHCSEAERS